MSGAADPRAALDGIVLALDASTYVGTVAVLRGGRVASARETAMRGADEERLMPAVVAALAESGVAVGALDAVVCGGGPGSFTSLRIAGSIAKGIAQATGVPLLAAPSLALAVAGADLPPGRYVATLDAMRGDRYAAEVRLDADGVALYDYLGVVPADAVAALAAARDARLVAPAGADGDAAGAIAAAPHARGVARLGALLAGVGAVALDAWEPDYGRKAEAQVKWELAHGRALHAGPGTPA